MKPPVSVPVRSARLGLFLLLTSSLAFGSSGSFARGLMDSGWAPSAAVVWRVTIAACLLAGPGLLAMRGNWHRLRTGWRSVAAFGLIAVAGTQFAYFQAIEHVPISVALLVQFCGIFAVVLWLWLRHGQRPRSLSVLGTVLAMIGLPFVIGVFGSFTVNLTGVMWGTLAAAGLATYFVMAADDASGLPPVALASGGMLVGALGLQLAMLAGLIDATTARGDVTLAGAAVPWWAALIGLGLISTALAYGLGIAGTRILGSKVASFVGLTELLFAILLAWMLVGQVPAALQVVGGVLIVAGVIAVKADSQPPVVAQLAAEAVPAPAPPRPGRNGPGRGDS